MFTKMVKLSIDGIWLQRDSKKRKTEEVDVVSLQPVYLCMYTKVSVMRSKMPQKNLDAYLNFWYIDAQMFLLIEHLGRISVHEQLSL